MLWPIFISFPLAVIAGDIPSALTGAGITAIFPNDDQFAQASQACKPVHF